MYGNIKLFQIKAIKDFGDVKKGDLGGWIEKKSNLSQEGNCWVFDGARVYGDALVSSSAWVCDNAIIYGNARVYGSAIVSGSAWVCGNASVSDSAWVCGNAIVKVGLKLDTGLCFARKEKDWNVSEVENEGIILLIRDYKPVEEKEVVELTVEEICDRLGYDVKIKK